MNFNQLYEFTMRGLSHGWTLEDIAKKHNVDISELQKQLDMGLEVEKEHDENLEIRKQIAMDHLVEDPEYYTKLATIHNG
jgi:hypothetical protein